MHVVNPMSMIHTSAETLVYMETVHYYNDYNALRQRNLYSC